MLTDITVFGVGHIMASGDPFILYILATTAVPYTYQPAVGITIVITSFGGVNVEIQSTQNTGTNYSRGLGWSKNIIGGGTTTVKTLMDNTTYIYISDGDLTTYGMNISGFEL